MPLALALAGCSGGGADGSAVLSTMAEVDPCDLLTGQERTDLQLETSEHAEEGHLRSCSLVTTHLLGDPSEDRIHGLELIVREARR